MRVVRTSTIAPLVLALLVGLGACGKPTYVEVSEPEPPPPSDPAADPLIEQEAVREAVRQYAKALDDHDVAGAAKLVVDETFGFYEDLRVAALRSTRDQLEGWDLLSLLMILQIRSLVSRAELEASDGRRLFETAVAAGVLGEGVGEVDLDEVWIGADTTETGTQAQTRAEIRIDGQAIVWLRKTDRWRVDIPEMIRLLGPAIERSVQDQVNADGKLRTAYTLLEVSSDAPIAFEVLDGPLEQTP